MNWITRELGQLVKEGEGRCKHLKVGDTSHTRVLENDGMGMPEVSNLCRVCNDESIKADAALKENCMDCGRDHCKAEMIVYHHAEFDPKQGDEEKFVCYNCMLLSTHQIRIRKDKAIWDAQFPADDY